MVNTLSGSVCAYRKETVKPRFIRIDEVMVLLDVTQDEATCGIFGETGTDSEIDKWLERMKEDKEKEDKKTENMIAIEATTKNKVGFDTYA